VFTVVKQVVIASTSTINVLTLQSNPGYKPNYFLFFALLYFWVLTHNGKWCITSCSIQCKECCTVKKYLRAHQ